MTPAEFATLATRFAEIVAGWPEYYLQPDGSPDEEHRAELAAVLMEMED
tara:strand:- start:924 stop:1070 length:147 start_codon:yes stop_codon:yes gene_type:complete